MPSSPAYTLKSRTSTPAPESARSPSPQHYRIPALVGGGLKGNATASSPPAFTMRPRTVEPLPSSARNPASNAYGVPGDTLLRPTTPAFSLRSRTGGGGAGGGGGETYDMLAAAAAASTLGHTLSPRFSMRPRTVDPSEAHTYDPRRARSPGPAAYTVPQSLGVTPFWPNTGGMGAVLTSRPHTSHTPFPTPGPLDYQPYGGNFSSTYPNPPTTRLDSRGPLSPTPTQGSCPPGVGPNSYAIPSNFTPSDRSPFKRSGGGFSITSRRVHGSPEEAALLTSALPAPHDYGRVSRPLELHPQPRFGTSARDDGNRSHSTSPAPGAPVSYAGVHASSPRYSLRSRSTSPYKPADTAGPAAFNLQGPSPVAPKAPSWSLRMRWRPERGGEGGPGSYGPLPLPHLAGLLVRTAYLGLESGENVIHTNPDLAAEVGGEEAYLAASARFSATAGASAGAAAGGGGGLSSSKGKAAQLLEKGGVSGGSPGRGGADSQGSGRGKENTISSSSREGEREREGSSGVDAAAAAKPNSGSAASGGGVKQGFRASAMPALRVPGGEPE